MKKKFALVILLVLVFMLTLTACNKNKKDNPYFNDFSSHGQFTEAEVKLSLPKDTRIFSYDVENKIFITYKLALNGYDETKYVYLFGMASLTEEYIAPCYTNVLEINGDYAIVTKPVMGVEDGTAVLQSNIGVIKFRGENKGELTDFRPQHNESTNLFRFVGEYISCAGTKENCSAMYDYTTFYDYSTGRLLEKFRIDCGAIYEFSEYDGYLVAVGRDSAYFYNTSSILSDGYLNLDERGCYIPYPEDADREYARYITVDVFYLGNGWFTRTAKLESTSKFTGYNMCYEKTDANTGEQSLVYANVRCDMYNAKTRSSTNKEWLFVENVANKYTADQFGEIAAYLNNLSASEGERYEYSLPFMDVSKMIKDGYSIVYYYYLPYVDDGNYTAEITFCIMNALGEVITIDDMLMPTVFVDGVGVETSDPMYEDYYGSVYAYDKTLKKQSLADYVGGQKSYATYIYHERGVVAKEINYVENSVLYGIVDTSGKVLVPFIYDELSPFYGGYAIGMRNVGGRPHTYRIDASGQETEISGVLNVRQGVYINVEKEKLGLKNYAGDTVIATEYDELEVFEVFLTDGVFQRSFAVATKDGVTTIFELR